ncbi:MAG: ABC transporter permease [Bacteroidota bacterium]|jgi:putative ABC transport system permease protein
MEGFLFALDSLRSNKLRTFLSLLGITIGIFAIITVFTITDSLNRNIRSSIASLGENVVFVQKWPWAFGGDYPWWKYMNRPIVSVKEAEELRHRLHLAEAVCFSASGSWPVRFKGNAVENTEVVMIGKDYDKVRTFEIGDGRYLSEGELSSGKAVCVIGSNIAQNLFESVDPIGMEVTVGNRRLRVVGVFAPEGTSIVGNSTDDQLICPVNLARNIVDLRKERFNPSILVKAGEGISNDELKGEIAGAMRSIRRITPSQEENFALNETNLLTQGFEGLFVIIALAGWIIGGFSILVGGFGIANIMFVTVKERTSQIGIQKALGARNSFILLQFLSESVLLSLSGGMLGLGIIFLGAWVTGKFIDFDIALRWNNIGLGLGISFVIGVISGLFPSLMAARLDPVEAMRK